MGQILIGAPIQMIRLRAFYQTFQQPAQIWHSNTSLAVTVTWKFEACSDDEVPEIWQYWEQWMDRKKNLKSDVIRSGMKASNTHLAVYNKENG